MILTGCKGSPEAIAYKTTASVVVSVDTGMRAWADYVLGQRRLIKATPVAERGTMEADLLRKEGKVREAYGVYQRAVAAAGATATVSPPDLTSAAAALLYVVKDLSR